MTRKSSEFDSKNNGWDYYWGNHDGKNSRKIYDVIASIYRTYIIKRALNFYIQKNFKLEHILLHAGCGSGQVDVELSKYYQVIALDISNNALNLYKKHNGSYCKTVKGSVFSLPLMIVLMAHII